MPPGMMPAPITAATQPPAACTDGNPSSSARARFRLADDPHGHLGNHAQQPLRAGDHPQQVVGFAVEVLAAEADDRAVDQHQLDAEKIVGRQPVLQAVHAAGILGDVAADRAGDLAGRIRSIVEAAMRHRVRDGEVGDARLDGDAAIVEVDLKDAVELAEGEQDTVGQRQCSARERGAGAARHHLDALGVAVSEDARDLLGILRQHHQHRRLPIGGQRIAFVDPEFVRLVDNPFARDDRAQRIGDLLRAGRGRWRPASASAWSASRRGV